MRTLAITTCMTHFWATVRAVRLLKVFGLMAEPERLCADDSNFS